MFPFNLKRAAEGAAVVTRTGDPARVLSCTIKNHRYPVVAIITVPCGEEVVTTFTAQGQYYPMLGETDNDLFMVVADQPPGVYALQRGTYATLAEAFDNGAVYRVDTLDEPTLQLEQSRAAIREQMVVAQATIAALGATGDWVVRFFNGEREYTYDDVTRMGDPREEKWAN